MIKLFAELLKIFNKGWLKQILTGAGLTLGTSAISLTALNSMITFFKSNIGQIPATILGLAHIAGFDYAISIILGAIVASHVQAMGKLTLQKLKA